MRKHSKLEQLIPLSHKVTVYVPATTDIDKPIDNAAWIDSTAKLLSNCFGDATSSPAMYNLYDIDAIDRARNELRKIPCTTTKKAGHCGRVEDLRKFLISCTQFNPYLFDPQHCYLFDVYRGAVNCGYHLTTKADLDTMLQQALGKIDLELATCIETEYQTRDGRLVPHPKREGEWIPAC